MEFDDELHVIMSIFREHITDTDREDILEDFHSDLEILNMELPLNVLDSIVLEINCNFGTSIDAYEFDEEVCIADLIDLAVRAKEEEA